MSVNSRVGGVLVGIDGSQHSVSALRWASRYAGAFDLELRVLAAWSWPVTYDATLTTVAYAPEADAKILAQEAIAGAGLSAAALAMSVVEGSAARELVAASSAAQLLVVGSHGRSEVRSALLGSVSRYCADHAAAPVAVIRREQPVSERSRREGPVVVAGVDGSGEGDRALRWAASYAGEIGGTLRVVSAWEGPDLAAREKPRVDLKRAMYAEDAVQEALELVWTVPDQVETRIVQGPAGSTLVTQSADADVLVVGSRDETAVHRALYGSVSDYCLRHADVPVVIVR